MVPWHAIKVRVTLTVMSVIFLPLLAIAGFGIYIFSGLPGEEEIRTFRIDSTVDSFGDFNWKQREDRPIRKVVPLEDIAESLQKAVIVSEDDLFMQHEGINIEMMKEAFKVNLERGKYARGASTITMQLARNAFLSKEKSIIRKLKEMVVARRMEEVLTKNRILELYLNIVEWGVNIYGAEAAARFYFGKSAASLSLAESSLLAGMLPNPKRYNPIVRMATVKKFQKRVLELMRLSRMIDAQTAKAAFEQPIRLRGQKRQTTNTETSLTTVHKSQLNWAIQKLDTVVVDELPNRRQPGHADSANSHDTNHQVSSE